MTKHFFNVIQPSSSQHIYFNLSCYKNRFSTVLVGNTDDVSSKSKKVSSLSLIFSLMSAWSVTRCVGVTLSVEDVVFFLYVTTFCWTFPLLGVTPFVVVVVTEVLLLLSLVVLEWWVSPYSHTSSSELKSRQMWPGRQQKYNGDPNTGPVRYSNGI